MFTQWPDVAEGAEQQAATALLSSVIAECYFEDLMRWLAAKPEESPEWQEAAHFGDTFVYATAAELRELAREVAQPDLRPARGRVGGPVRPPPDPDDHGRSRPRGAAGPDSHGSLSAGVRVIAHSRVVRASLGAAAFINFFSFVFVTLFALYATRYLHVRPGVLGVILGAGAVGGVLGALVTGRLARRLGVGWTFVAGCVLFPAPLALVPLASGPRVIIIGALFGSEFFSGVGVMILDISIGSIFAAVIPDQLRSQVTGAFQAVNFGTRPAGSLVAGAPGMIIGIRPALWFAAIGGLTGFLRLLPSPLPGFRLPPENTPGAFSVKKEKSDIRTHE
jgi:Na+/melibiose symporter-like transporter